MADVNHATLTDPELHEPKGVAAAASGEVYVADGGGSGAWTTINNKDLVFVHYRFDNISTASSQWIIPGIAGTITKIQTVINGAIATADCGMSFEIAGTPITSGGITIAFSGSAAGDIDSSTPSAANVVTANQAIEIISDGASTNNIDATVTFTIDVS